MYKTVIKPKLGGVLREWARWVWRGARAMATVLGGLRDGAGTAGDCDNEDAGWEWTLLVLVFIDESWSLNRSRDTAAVADGDVDHVDAGRGLG